MSALNSVLAHIKSCMDAALERLFALLRLPSISAVPQYAAACRACAQWHVEDLKSIGFSASARDTPGHPIVVAHDRRSHGMSALFYGHYDVQPVDPLNLWSRDPFDPAIETTKDGANIIRGRGASDDKGQVMTFIEACRAWKAVTGRLPIPISILIEGEEESGGTQSAAISRNTLGRIARGYWADLRYKYVGQQHTGHHHDASRSLCRGGDHNSRELRPSFRILWFGGGESQPDPRAYSGRSARFGWSSDDPRVLRQGAGIVRGPATAVGHVEF